MKRLALLLMVLLFLGSCKNNTSNQPPTDRETIQSVTPTESVEPIISDNSDLIKNKGIGPVKNVDIGQPINQEMAKRGEQHFKSLCLACHKPAKKFIGPAPKDILKRRSPEWVMNIIINPEEMIQKDPIAIQLFEEYNAVAMPNQNVSEQQAREILEYFRTIQ